MKDVVFLVDYLTFTARGFFEDDFLYSFKDEYIYLDEQLNEIIDVNKAVMVFIREVLKISDSGWQQINGNYGYTDCLMLGSIRVYYGGRTDMPICVSMSGQGCRSFESLSTWDWLDFMQLLVDRKEANYCNITRLDVACDETSGYLDLRQICEYTLNDRYVKKFKRHTVTYSTEGTSVYFGSPSSDIRVRIYDKAAERGVDGHWIRLEIQLRDDMAFQMCKNILYFGSVGYCFAGVMLNYLRFIEDGENKQNCRSEVASWWQDFIGITEKIRLFKRVGMEYNLSAIEDYLVNQVLPSLFTYVECKGNKLLALLDLLHGAEHRLNKRQVDLINLYKGRRDNVAFENGSE